MEGGGGVVGAGGGGGVIFVVGVFGGVGGFVCAGWEFRGGFGVEVADEGGEGGEAAAEDAGGDFGGAAFEVNVR